MALTKVSGGILDPGINVAGIVTATGFDGPFIGGSSKNIVAGIITATELDISGNIDVDGHTELDQLNVSGVSTFVGNIGGTPTFTGDVTFNGNVSIAQTLTYSDVTNIDSVGIITARDHIKIVTDNKRLSLGASEDLRIYHSTFNYIESYNDSEIHINANTGGSVENMAKFKPNGAVELYNNGSKKFETVPNGVTVTGSSTFSQIKFKTSDGTNRGSIYADNSNSLFLLDGQDHQFMQCIKDGAVTIRHDNSIVLRTYSTGVEIVGALYATSVDLNDDQKILLGTGDDLELYHGSNASYIKNNTGPLNIRNAAQDQDVVIQGNDGGSNISMLYFDTSEAGNATFTGDIKLTDGKKLNLGHSNDLSLGHLFINNSHNGVINNATNVLFIESDSIVFRDKSGEGAETLAQFIKNGSCSLYYDNVAVLSTSEYGLVVKGTSGGIGQITLSADANEDNADKFKLVVEDNGPFRIQNRASASWETNIECNGNGNVELYYNNVKQIETVSSGVLLPDMSTNKGRLAFGDLGTRIEGGAGAGADDGIHFMTNSVARWQMNPDGDLIPNTAGAVDIGSASKEIGNVYIADDKKITIGTGDDFEISHSAGVNFLFSPNNRQLQLKGDGGLLIRAGGNQLIANFLQSAVTLYHNVGNLATARLTTTSTGITVGGEVKATQDYPNFRPTVDFNFAATKKLDPRITYTRTGPASYYDEFGKVVLVGDNVPRFDHDPTTRECKGLLIEETSTNEWGNSEALHNGTNGYTLPNGLTTPAGGSTAVKIPAGANNLWWSAGSGGFAVTSGDYWTMSWWAYSTIQSVDFGNSDYFYVSNTTISQDKTVPAGQWKRCFRTVQFNASGSPQIRFMPYNSTLYTDTNNEVFVWGFQFEKTKFPTSYIPSYGSATNRGTEITLIDGEEFSEFYNPIESTILIDYTHDITSSQLGNNQRVYKFQAVGGSDTRIDYVSNSGYNPYIAKDGSAVASISHGQSTVFGGGVNRSAVRVKENSFAVSFNGSAVSGNAEDTSGGWNPTNTITEVTLGSSNDGNSPVNGHIQRFAYYPVGLPNSQLVTLTS